jgi:hypothetical protein
MLIYGIISRRRLTRGSLAVRGLGEVLTNRHPKNLPCYVKLRKVSDVQCTVYNVRCTMHGVQCTVYDVRCTM